MVPVTIVSVHVLKYKNMHIAVDLYPISIINIGASLKVLLGF